MRHEGNMTENENVDKKSLKFGCGKDCMIYL
ncbi:MAG: hypothetical protein KatS3mg035_0032 [Bacteroidia bacterium]|nr:MAG: hypothetical protein KatS3mg035_0032 [Bacteroidia bacterium]